MTQNADKETLIDWREINRRQYEEGLPEGLLDPEGKPIPDFGHWVPASPIAPH
jgi:hypothetical protein